MLVNKKMVNRKVATQFGTITFNEKGQSTDLNAEQEKFLGKLPGYQYVNVKSKEEKEAEEAAKKAKEAEEAKKKEEADKKAKEAEEAKKKKAAEAKKAKKKEEK